MTAKSSMKIVMNEVVTDIPFDAPKEISITGIINNNEHVQYEKNLLEKKAQETRNLFIFGALTTALYNRTCDNSTFAKEK